MIKTLFFVFSLYNFFGFLPSLNLDFADNNTSWCFFLFFLIIDLNLLILAVITQGFNPIAELVIVIGIKTNKSKAEMEMHPITV